MTDVILNPRDIRNDYILTKMIEKRAKEHEVYSVPFMPLVSYGDRQILVHVTDYTPAGLAPFKADEGSTPILQIAGTVEERRIDLVTIGEKAVIGAKTLLYLASSDDRVAKSAAQTILQLGRSLRVRNTQRTMWMAWQAVQDTLAITYPDGGAISIDFDMDASSQNASWSGSHLPTVTTAWSDASADIIGDVQTWADLIETDHGTDQAQMTLHVNSVTWRYMKANTALRAELSSYQPRIITPQMPEVAEILGIAKIVIINDFYKDETRTKYKFLPDLRALFTAPYTHNGDNIAEMLDGPVVMVQGEALTVANNPGARSEMYVSKEQAAENIRITTARMPILHYPEAIVWGDVSGP